MEEILVIAFHAKDRRIDDVDLRAAMLDYTAAHAVDRGLASVRIADDAAFADMGSPRLELRFDEENRCASPGAFRRAESAENGRQHEGRGDEGDIHRQEGGSGLACNEEFARREQPRVGALAEGDASIVAELLGNLAVAGIDGHNTGGSGLQHAVGEAAGRGSHIDAGESVQRDAPMGERALQLETAAADVPQVGAEQADGGGRRDGGAGFVDALLVDQNPARENERLSAFAGGGMTQIDQQLVQTQLRRTRCGGAGWYGIGHLSEIMGDCCGSKRHLF